MTEHRLDDIMIIMCENDIAQGKEDSSVGRPTLMLTLIRFHSNYLFLTL